MILIPYISHPPPPQYYCRYRDTYCAGTVRINRKGLPKAVTRKKPKLKKGEAVYRRKDYLLCLKIFDKRPVTMLSSRHNAAQSFVKNNYLGQPVKKPIVIQDYNKFMGGVDNSDNLLEKYLTLKGLKWYRKLLLHLINMVVLNSYILNKKYGVRKMTHSCYREYIAKYLLTTSLESATCTKKKIPIPIDNTPLRLTGRHFITKFKAVPGSKRKTPARKCRVCNFTTEQLEREGHRGLVIPPKYSSYGCDTCGEITLCISPCFELFHTISNYRAEALNRRVAFLL